MTVGDPDTPTNDAYEDVGFEPMTPDEQAAWKAEVDAAAAAFAEPEAG